MSWNRLHHVNQATVKRQSEALAIQIEQYGVQIREAKEQELQLRNSIKVGSDVHQAYSVLFAQCLHDELYKMRPSRRKSSPVVGYRSASTVSESTSDLRLPSPSFAGLVADPPMLNPTTKADKEDNIDHLRNFAPQLLEDEETRVRLEFNCDIYKDYSCFLSCRLISDRFYPLYCLVLLTENVS